MADKEEGEENLPRVAKIVKSLLKSIGVQEYEPHVIHQFVELWYRFIVDALTDAQVYSEHAGKPTVECDDLKLAIQTKVNVSFSQPPPREVLLELARIRNKNPLSKSIVGSGIPLPPEEDLLISPNYQFASPKKHRPQVTEETEEDDVVANENPPREQNTDQQQQQTSQRVSFPLVGKRGS